MLLISNQSNTSSDFESTVIKLSRSNSIAIIF